MLKTGEKLGAFIVPTGIGASIGGYAGDASVWAREFAKHSKLIVNPNVVNAGGFSGITDNMLYVEGYTLDSFFKGEINLKESQNNKIGVVFDKNIPKDVLNVHINTINAVKTVYGTDVAGYEVTDDEVGVEFFMTQNNISTGNVKNIETLKSATQRLIDKYNVNAIALVCLFEDSDALNENYCNGTGTDPVGGVEAVLSHYISKEFKLPCAHSPAFEDYSIHSDLVNPKSASEYITPTFLPCILLGLANAPHIGGNINIANVDYLVMPYNALGSTPVFEALKQNIPIFAVKENSTTLDVTNDNLHKSNKIIIAKSYKECLNMIKDITKLANMK